MNEKNKPSIVCVKAHPDDLAGMAGTALKLTADYELHVICLTRGERGLPGKSMEEAAAIRTKEEEAACAKADARLHFAGCIDGELFADRETCETVAKIIADIKPVAVFAQWPIDLHPDHSASSEIARKAVALAKLDPEIIFWESNPVGQSLQFDPDIYVDISDVIDGKLDIRRTHVSQNNREDDAGKRWRKIASFRGVIAGCQYAEAFKFMRPITANSRHSLLLEIQPSAASAYSLQAFLSA